MSHAPFRTPGRTLPWSHLGVSLVALSLLACNGNDKPIPMPGTAPAPTLTTFTPADQSTGIALNTTATAVFDRAMAPLDATTFTLTQGGILVPGAVSNSGDGLTGTFTPANPLVPSTVFTATVTTGAMSSAGTHLAASRSWTFTTTVASGLTAPVAASTQPMANATGVGLNTGIEATFSEAMDPLTLTASTFLVKQGNNPVAGTISFGPNGTTATFTPSSLLTASTVYGVTLTPGVKDLAGTPLAAAVTWTFTTGTAAAMGPAVVNLGNAGNYAILAKTGISTVPSSAVTGDIGLSPAAASFLTGFSLTADATNVFSTSPQITGKAFAANFAVPTPSNLTTAVGDMLTAYADAAGRPTPDFLNLGSGNIGGLTLAPGLYHWTSSVTVPTDVVINGGANDVWIFQTTGDLSMTGSKHITLSGGAQAKNIFWQVAGQVTIGTGAHFEGILLCETQVTLQTLATMNGRILAQTLVALQQATVTAPQ